MIQQGLRLAIGIQTQIERQHLFPRPVEECNLPSAMCAGGVHFSRLLAVCFYLRCGESGRGQAVSQPAPEQSG